MIMKLNHILFYSFRDTSVDASAADDSDLSDLFDEDDQGD